MEPGELGIAINEEIERSIPGKGSRGLRKSLGGGGTPVRVRGSRQEDVKVVCMQVGVTPQEEGFDRGGEWIFAGSVSLIVGEGLGS